MPCMGKTEEDWNGLKLGFLKTVQPNSFSELIPAACNFKNNAQETYLFVSDLWFCHLYVIYLHTLSSIAIEGEKSAKLNKMNWTAVTAPLRPFNLSENVQEHARNFYNYPSISGVKALQGQNTLSRYDSHRISIMVSIYRFGVDWARYM